MTAYRIGDYVRIVTGPYRGVVGRILALHRATAYYHRRATIESTSADYRGTLQVPVSVLAHVA